MKMKFCANLSFMFTESGFLERYSLAKKAGFQAVESGFPFGISSKDVVKAKSLAGIEQVLINTYTGDVTKGEVGFAAIPGKEKEFMESLETTINLANALNCKKIHVMAGKVITKSNQNDGVYISNLKKAEQLLRKHNIVGLIEPINEYSVPNYYLNSYRQAVDVIETINSPHIRLMLDLFHLQQIQGNITRSITNLMPFVGHVQIAQVPDRHEPHSPGEINYDFVLKSLEEAGYKDWIGLEYKPAVDTQSGLVWMEKFC